MKQVIVVNEALNLPRGKLAAQVAHAAVAAFLEAKREAQRSWLTDGMPKVVVRCGSEAELLDIQAQAERLGLPVAPIRDASHTVVAADTLTSVGIGPAGSDAIDAVTRSLKLVR
jgi:peptidyl-tRNA hydrolase, PTH2 family